MNIQNLYETGESTANVPANINRDLGNLRPSSPEPIKSIALPMQFPPSYDR